MDIQIKKEELRKEYSQVNQAMINCQNRLQQIIGAITLLEEMEKVEPKKEDKEAK
jgi:hypothetical protein